MVQLIVGVKGTGKTKTLIHLVNKAVEESKGDVVCIEQNKKLTYDINYKARLISAAHYGVSGFSGLYGFVAGILAGNYDVTDLFIDSALKIGGGDLKEFEKFIADIEKIAGVDGVDTNLVLTVSANPGDIPENLRKYIRE